MSEEKFTILNNYSPYNSDIEYPNEGWYVSDPYENNKFEISESGTIYRVLLNGEDIYNPLEDELTLLSPVLEMEVNEPGSLEFTMPPFHKFYESIIPFSSFIEVYEENDLIWFGRPIEIEIDFYKQKKVYCEGALGFLRDGVIDQFGEHDNEPYYAGGAPITSIRELCDSIIGSYNGSIRSNSSSAFNDPAVIYINNKNKLINNFIFCDYENFRINGDENIDKTIDGISSDEGWFNTLDVLREYIIDGYGYYVVPRREFPDYIDPKTAYLYPDNYESAYSSERGMAGHSFNFLDLYEDYPFVSSDSEYSQPIDFGLNLLDVSIKFDGNNYCTSVLPLGPTVTYDPIEQPDGFRDPWLVQHSSEIYPYNIYPDAGDPDGGRNLTLQLFLGHKDANGEWIAGGRFLDSEAVETYGRIIHIKNFEDVQSREELYERAKEYLENSQFNALTIECSATDLHRQNFNYSVLKLGMVVHIKSTPHLIDRDFPISKMSIKLDNAAKQITLGTVPRKELTKLKEKKQNNKWVGSLTDFQHLSVLDSNKVYYVY